MKVIEIYIVQDDQLNCRLYRMEDNHYFIDRFNQFGDFLGLKAIHREDAIELISNIDL